MVFKRNLKNKMLIGTMVLSLLSVNTTYSFGEEKREVVDIPSSASFYHKKMIGKDRYETSNKILKEMGTSNETIIIVNASEIMSDGLSASALAGKLKANIVPINPKKVNKNTMEKVKKAKTVYLIGGYNAIPKSFESNLKNKKVVRLGGKDRVETSEKIANYVGTYKKAYIVNGYTGQADAMSISPVAARDVSPIILTKKSSSEVEKKDKVEYTIIGGENAVSTKIQKRFSSKRIDGKDRYETNRNVLNKFYPNRKSLSFCNGETLVDALSGTVYAKDEGIALVNRKKNLDLLEHISTSQLGGLPFDVNFVYGSSGGSGGSGGGTVVTNKAPSKPEILANQTDEYKENKTKRKVEIKITKESVDPEGDNVTYEYEGKSADDFYEVGKTYTVKVRAKDSKEKYSEYAEVTFTVDEHAILLQGAEIIENPDNPEEPGLKPILIGKIFDIIGKNEGKIKFEEKVSKETFENIKKEKEYKALDINEKGEIIGYLEKDQDDNVVHIISQKEINTNPNASFTFALPNIKSIEGLENIDTYNTTNMSSMFSGCEKLTSLDLSNFDTSKVTDMSSMFSWCSELTSLDLGKFNTSKVTDMSSMFSGLKKLTSLDLSNFDTSKVTNMSSMFSRCSELTSLDLGKFNTSKVTDMSSMFSGLKKLTSLDLSNFDTSNITNMSSMFYNSTITNLDLNNWNTSNVTNMSEMFYESTIPSLDLSNWNTSKVTNISQMFRGSTIPSLNLSNWNTHKVTDMSGMFANSTLETLNVSGWDTSNVTDMSWMFNNCQGLESLDLSSWNTSNVTKMDRMFYCTLESSLKTLNLRGWNTSNVTDMDFMFTGCKALTNLKLDTFNKTINKDINKSMLGMFSRCSALTSLDIKDWNTSNVTNMSQMFEECENLKELNLSGWDTSSVAGSSGQDTGMEGMFKKCKNLKKLILSEKWDTSNVVNMSFMFYNCGNLENIVNTVNFNLNSVKDMQSIFENCYKIKTDIYVRDKKDGTVNEDECNTKGAFLTATDLAKNITINYKSNNENVKKFIEENLKKNNPENDNIKYEEIKNNAPTV